MANNVKTLPTAETLETPTAKMVRESNPLHSVVDSLGRTIQYRTLNVIERARLARVLGADSGNPIYFGMMATAYAVQDIDGHRGPPKTNINFLESRLEWLGDEGWDAIADDSRQRTEQDEDPIDAAKN